MLLGVKLYVTGGKAVCYWGVNFLEALILLAF